jgi:GAF domain
MAAVRATEILAELAGQTPAEGEPGLPQRLVEACAAALPVSGVGLIVMTDSGPGSILAATDGAARVMEELQFTLGEGPCVDASRERRPVLQPDLEHTAPQRWPAFAAGALDAGIRAIFALPLQVGGIPVGVLDLYRDTDGTLEDAELAEALAFADAATTVLLHLHTGSGPNRMHPGLVALVENRAEVHQATGMVSVQAVLGLAEALLLLRAHAYSAERPILDVARDVLARILRFAPEDDHHE